MAIPRILHRIWVGPNPFPDEYAAYGEGWKRLHPEWEHRLWTEDNLPGDLERREAYEEHRVPAERADILRYELLWRHGGVYVDADMEGLRPLDDLLAGLEFFIAQNKPDQINNGILGSAPGHPIIREAMDEAAALDWNDPAMDWRRRIKHDTGPGLMARIVARHPEAEVFPPPVFYPRTEEERGSAYARHYSALSWRKWNPPDGELRLLRAQLKASEAAREKAEARIRRLEERLARERQAYARLERSPLGRVGLAVARRLTPRG